MNHIIGMSYLLAKEVTDEKSKDRLTKIQHSSQHLLGLINDILDFTWSESELIKLEAVDFKLAALLDHVERDIREEATAKGLELVREVDPDLPPWLKGDQVHLCKILENLLSNAVKFSDQGQISVRVRLIESHANYVSVRFEVQDQGIGMSPEQQARLFELFTQGDSSLSRKYGGTGLGLAHCRRLVSLMAGEMGATSTAGNGSTFWFTLRLQVGTAPAAMTSGAESAGWEHVRTTVTSLERYLAEYDASALTLWDTSQQVLEPLLEGQLESFAEAMDRFDFEAARQVLREAVAQHPELSR